MRVSPNADGSSGGGAGVGAGRSPSGSSSSSVNSKFTRAATGVPSLMTNKGSVYKAQRGKGVSLCHSILYLEGASLAVDTYGSSQ